jgi:signal transduction histidine kinase
LSKEGFIHRIKDRLQNLEPDACQSLNEKKKIILLNIFFNIAGAVLLFFIVINSLNRDYKHLFIDLSVFLLLIFFYFLFKIKKQPAFTSYSFVFLLFVLAFFYVFTGGIENTGLIFIVLLPVPVIMLIGRRRGLLVLAAFFVIITVGLSVFREIQWVAEYPPEFSMRIYICFLIITALGYINESAFEIVYSRLQKTADSLTESRERYKSLSLSREKFLSIISHDLKNQVAAFYSATDILKNNYSDLQDEERLDLIETAWQGSQKNVQLLKDLLKWSMIRSDTFPYNPVNVKIEKIYKDVVELFELEIEKKNISVFLKMKSNSEVFADYDMLSSIMRNLLSNAVKFVGNNGEISIKAEEKGDFMNIEVCDNGPGIDDKTLENLKRSVSASMIGEDNRYGSGIGLMLVREFVECCKGKLSIESQPGRGTCIAFTVPLAE